MMAKMIKKIIPHDIPPDLCQPSLDWLENRIGQWFNHFIPDHGQVWISDNERSGLAKKFPNKNRPVEVVLLGSFAKRFLESEAWDFQSMRLWVLSSSIRRNLIELFHLSPENIGLIPRDQLIKPAALLSDLNTSWVYAGRLSPAKNIAGMLEIVSILQIDHKLNIEIDLFGEFDDNPDPSWGRFAPFSYRQYVDERIESLSWSSPPRFHGMVSEQKWSQFSLEEKRMLISLSSGIEEDFGVSSALAKELGLPTLLSNWGGHRDHSGRGQHHLNLCLIPQTYEPLVIQQAKAKHCASYIANLFKTKASSTASLSVPNPLPLPQWITPAELAISRQKMMRRWNPGIQFAVRGQWDTFADSSQGVSFFKKYRTNMEGGGSSSEVFIINDLHNKDDQGLLAIKKYLSSLEHFNGEFISWRDLFNAHYVGNFSHCSKITILYPNVNMIAAIQYIKDVLDSKASIRIVLPEGADDSFKDILSSEDQILFVSIN
jgi:hypothetical protein